MTRKLLVLTCAAAALAGGASLAQDQSQPQYQQPSVGAPADTAVNPPLDNEPLSQAPAPAEAASPAATPAAEPASATVSSMAYAANIANAPGGVFKANVGNYPMSHYAMPSRPLPYDQVEAYLKASRSQQLAQNWWSGAELASNEAAATPASSDVSVTTSTSGPDAATTASGTAGLPGDTPVGLKDETSVSETATPISSPPAPDPTLAPDAPAPTSVTSSDPL
jgi:hypothetical protein